MKPKLLVVELWGLGDLVIATPFIRAATERYSVTLLAKPVAAELRPRLWPSVEIMPFTAPWTAFRFGAKYSLWRWPWRDLSDLTRRLRSTAFDCGVSGRWDPRDHVLLRATGARERLGFPRLGSQLFLTRALGRPEPLAHRSEYWRAAASALGLVLPPKATLFASQPVRPPVILIHTGAALPLRVWPLQNFRDLAIRLRQSSYAVKIACNPDQLQWWREQGEEVLCPRTIAELFACLDGSGVFIGNDSGSGHLAASCGLPTFTLFGPQLPELFAPMHPAAEVFEGHPCPHKPCSDYCRYETPICLWPVLVDEVWPRVAAFAARHLAQSVPATGAPTKSP